MNFKFLVMKNRFLAASLLVIVLLVSEYVCNGNINSDHPLQQQPYQPPKLDQSVHHHQNISPSLSSPPPEPPRRIGLDINGRVKSLLWSNPQASIDSELTPLFSSSSEDEVKDDGHQTNKKSLVNVNNFLSVFVPGEVYGTADYRFRKERWYGLEKLGMIFRWKASRPDDESRDDNSLMKNLRSSWSPNKLDIAVHRSIFPNSNEDSTSLIDSGNIRLGWQQNYDGDIIGTGDANPWIQIGFDSRFSASQAFLPSVASNELAKNPLHLRFFLPLIRRRFDLQWTSRWNNVYALGSRGRLENGMRDQWSSKHRGPNEDPWWVPQVSLDPSTGTLSSKNRYRDQFLGNDKRQYLTEFKLRIRTTMPTLLSSVTNTVMGASDEDDDLQTASLRLEYSLMTDPVERGPGATCTTARFETIIVPSFWFRSVTETAKIGLIHEQNHVTNR